MSSVSHFIAQLIIVHVVDVGGLFQQVHLHLKCFVEQHLQLVRPLVVIRDIYFKLLSVSASVRNAWLLESETVSGAQLIDLVDVELGHQLVNKLLLNREIVFDVVMQDFQPAQNLGVQRHFLKKLLADLVVLDHAENTHFVDARNQNLLAEVVLLKFFHERSTLLPHVLSELLLRLCLHLEGFSAFPFRLLSV